VERPYLFFGTTCYIKELLKAYLITKFAMSDNASMAIQLNVPFLHYFTMHIHDLTIIVYFMTVYILFEYYFNVKSKYVCREWIASQIPQQEWDCSMCVCEMCMWDTQLIKLQKCVALMRNVVVHVIVRLYHGHLVHVALDDALAHHAHDRGKFPELCSCTRPPVVS